MSWQKAQAEKTGNTYTCKADAHRYMSDTRVEKEESSGQSHGDRGAQTGFVCTEYGVDIWRKRVSEILCQGHKEKDKEKTWASTTRTLEHPTSLLDGTEEHLHFHAGHLSL